VEAGGGVECNGKAYGVEVIEIVKVVRESRELGSEGCERVNKTRVGDGRRQVGRGRYGECGVHSSGRGRTGGRGGKWWGAMQG
jgi:hypothetical protein